MTFNNFTDVVKDNKRIFNNKKDTIYCYSDQDMYSAKNSLGAN